MNFMFIVGAFFLLVGFCLLVSSGGKDLKGNRTYTLFAGCVLVAVGVYMVALA